MFTHKNLMTVCCAAVLAFGLAACGGGGGGDEMAAVIDTGTGTDTGTDVTAPTPEEMAAATKAAKTKLDAIGEIDAAEGLGGTTETEPSAGEEGSYELSVKRDRMATTVTVTVNGAPEADAEKFTQAMDLGGGLTMHTRDGEMGVQEIAMVMTDIAEPTATPFGMVHTLNADEDGTDATGPDAVAIKASEDGDDPAEFLANMMSSVFAAAAEGSSSLTHTFLPAADDGDPDTPGDQPREAAMVAGYYDGAMGTYTCFADANASCTVDVNGKGELTAASDGWIFTPADGAKVDVADMDFLSYGFWLKKTTTDGVVTYNEVAPFAMAHGMGMPDTTGTVTGSASYEGDAVGVYVHNVLTAGGGMVESRTAGHFTAKASLMAYFGNPEVLAEQDIPPNMENTVTGTINKFMLAGEEDNDWSVALKGKIDPTDFVITEGTANGGGMEGDLTGQFYGGGGDANANETPGAMTGEFNANFSNGSVAGGFGVNKE